MRPKPRYYDLPQHERDKITLAIDSEIYVAPARFSSTFHQIAYEKWLRFTLNLLTQKWSISSKEFSS